MDERSGPFITTSVICANNPSQHLVAESVWGCIRTTGSTVYLIIDEAHKGLGPRSAAQLGEERTILSRLIVGGHGVVAPPLLVGVSATPQRFKDLLQAATQRVTWPTNVRPEDVRESGLIKDEIVLWRT